MPPKKKPRLSRAPSTTSVDPLGDRPQPAESRPSPVKQALAMPEGLPSDPWTDEQEICLFKGMIRWKPVGLSSCPAIGVVLSGPNRWTGMHKHFRMIALSQHMKNHGHRDIHTSPVGIWAKLRSLYNLKILDERVGGRGRTHTWMLMLSVRRMPSATWAMTLLSHLHYQILNLARVKRKGSSPPLYRRLPQHYYTNLQTIACKGTVRWTTRRVGDLAP